MDRSADRKSIAVREAAKAEARDARWKREARSAHANICALCDRPATIVHHSCDYGAELRGPLFLVPMCSAEHDLLEWRIGNAFQRWGPVDRPRWHIRGELTLDALQLARRLYGARLASEQTIGALTSRLAEWTSERPWSS